MSQRCLKGLMMILVFGAITAAVAEEITLVTYYPSPRGVYEELRTTRNTYLATQEGNVGIGTAGPITHWGKGLDVHGNIAIHMAPSDAGLLFGDDDPVNAKWHIGYWEPSIMPPNGGLVFTESGVADYILTLRAGGNVGIGTANPGDNKLQVQGDINVSGGVYRSEGVAGLNETIHLGDTETCDVSHTDYTFTGGILTSTSSHANRACQPSPGSN